MTEIPDLGIETVIAEKAGLAIRLKARDMKREEKRSWTLSFELPFRQQIAIIYDRRVVFHLSSTIYHSATNSHNFSNLSSRISAAAFNSPLEPSAPAISVLGLTVF